MADDKRDEYQTKEQKKDTIGRGVLYGATFEDLMELSSINEMEVYSMGSKILKTELCKKHRTRTVSEIYLEAILRLKNSLITDHAGIARTDYLEASQIERTKNDQAQKNAEYYV